MKEEISAGIILFNEVKERKFLLLNYPSKHWDFVKGKMEKGETFHETALRETNEETGITDVEFLDGFKQEIEYYFRADNQDIHKKVIFFLGKTKTSDVMLSHEHLDFMWLDYEDALKKITYNNAKNLLKKSSEFLDNRISN
ncbi:MAG: NUDIX domain-containing protein [Candidatus Nitrosopelagicus sp.]|jgi:8-oxo-dGTP pyrophosphatase MutT (NUDIX family)|nr:NUDIX domain-containing protein [Candidatus Nitrosopelagicus sp.]